MNPYGVYRLARAQIDHCPLQMGVFGLAGEMRIEIWITFPKRIAIAVSDARVTIIICLIDGVSAPRQPIAIRNVNRFGNGIVRGPISTLMNRISPPAAWIPMPDFAGKLGAQPIGQRPKSG